MFIDTGWPLLMMDNCSNWTVPICKWYYHNLIRVNRSITRHKSCHFLATRNRVLKKPMEWLLHMGSMDPFPSRFLPLSVDLVSSSTTETRWTSLLLGNTKPFPSGRITFGCVPPSGTCWNEEIAFGLFWLLEYKQTVGLFWSTSESDLWWTAAMFCETALGKLPSVSCSDSSDPCVGHAGPTWGKSSQ